MNTIDQQTIDEEAEEVWMNELVERYEKLEVDFDVKMKDHNTVQTNFAPAPVATEMVTAKPAIKLGPMKKPEFDGNIRKYPNFKKHFEAHVKPLCTEEQLAFVLRSCLSESIQDDIDSLGDNADDIMERLDRMFGDQSRLVDIILADIKSIDNYNDDDSTLHMIKIIERCYYDLKTMQREAEMNNTTIISMIEGKMPDEMSNEWIKIITKSTAHADKFPLLQNLLDDWRKRIEYKIANIRSNPPIEGTTNLVAGDRNQRSNQSTLRHKCWIHTNPTNGVHPIWKCKAFQGMDVQERIELARQKGACLICLEIGHLQANCTKNFKCTQNNCNEYHNKLLCTKQQHQQRHQQPYQQPQQQQPHHQQPHHQQRQHQQQQQQLQQQQLQQQQLQQQQLQQQ